MKTSLIHTSLSRLLSFFDNYAYRIIFTLALLAFVFLLGVRLAGIFITDPDPWVIVENSVIYSVQRMLGGYPLYTDPELAPYAITQYTPVYYHILYWGCKILNIQAGDILAIYKLSRTISLSFNLLFASILSLIAFRFFNVRRSAAFFIGMLAFLILQPHSYSRPDSVYNAMVLLTVFCYLQYLRQYNSPKSIVPLVITAFVAVVSIFSKQSGIILPALLLFYQLIILKNLRGTVVLILSFTGFIALFLFLFSGDSLYIFYKNVVRGLDNGIDLIWFGYYIVKGYFFTMKGVLLAPLCLYSAFVLVQAEKKTETFLGWAMLALFSFALLTGLKNGSTHSYFTEAGVLGLIGFTFIKNKIKLPGALLVLFMSIVISALVLDQKVMNLTNGVYTYSKQNFEKQRAVYEFVSTNYKLRDDELIYIDMPGWEDFLVGMFYRKGAFPHKDIINCCAWPRKSFDYSNFSELKKQGKVKYVISQKEHVEYVGVNFDDYKKIKEMNGYLIYEAPSIADSTAVKQNQ